LNISYIPGKIGKPKKNQCESLFYAKACFMENLKKVNYFSNIPEKSKTARFFPRIEKIQNFKKNIC
jgi:hypothetical protein